MASPFVRNICRIFGHDDSIQGPECGSVCKRCEEYEGDEDVLGEVKFFRRLHMDKDITQRDERHPACHGCVARHMRRAVREGRASIRLGCEDVFSEKYFG